MEYFTHILIFVGIFSILAVSLQFVVGYTGLLSVAHAAFFGIGAYITAILITQQKLPFIPSMLISVVGTMFVAALIGLVLSKLRSDYYALGSLGFGAICYSVFLNWQDVTRGPLGIPGILRPEFFGYVLADSISFLVLTGIAFALIYWLAKHLTTSSFGRILTAIREDQDAIAVFGYRTILYKLVIFVIAAGMAAIAGSLYATYVRFIDPSTFITMESVFILMLVVLGGLGSLRGAVIGTIIVTILLEGLRYVGLPPDIAGYARLGLYGLGLIFLMLYRPQGLVGTYRL